MRARVKVKVFGSFLIAGLFAFSSQFAGAAVVAGEPDPDALDHWALRTNIFFKAITYGQGKLVGVTSEGIYNSSNGQQWRKVFEANYAFDAIYAAGTFLVVGELGGVWRSTTGANWIIVTSPYWFYGITYADGKFVAVGSGGAISVSETLGVTWTNTVPATNGTLWSVAYGVGQFVAVGDNGRTLRSTNGYDWVSGNVGTNAPFYDVVYGQGLFVAVAYGALIYTSEDGIVWTQQQSPVSGAFYNVIYQNGMFVTAGVDAVASSVDGRTWVKRVAPRVSSQNIFTVAVGGDTTFVSAAGQSGLFSGALWESPPLVYTEPQIQLATNVAAQVGTTLRLEAVVTGTPPFSYQWARDASALEGMTNATLTISNVSVSHVGNYHLRVTNIVSAVLSDPVDLQVGVGPTIASPVPHVTTVVGGTAVLSSSSAGTPPLTFIWRRPDLGATSAVHTVSGSNSFLRLSPVAISDAGVYGVTVTNLFGTNISFGGSGRVTVQADNDGDGIGDGWETRYGLNTNDATDASLDLDGDQHSSLQEFLAGTDPTNSASVLRISAVDRNGVNGVHLNFSATSNMTYSIQAKIDAGIGQWMRVRDVPAVRTNRNIDAFDFTPEAAEGSRIYRIVTPAQP